jgi:hypothetical protein
MNWAEYLSWRDPRIRSFDQYLLEDPTTGNFATGLLYANGTRKPGYAAYRMPLFLPITTARRRAPLEVWGCVRPFHYLRSAAQRVEIQFKADSGPRFHTISSVKLTEAYGYFDVRQAFSSSGSVRLKWSYPRGPTIFSRTVGVTVR